MTRLEYFQSTAILEGWAVVSASPDQNYAHEGPCLHNKTLERDHPLGDYEGALRLSGWPFDNTPEAEVAAFSGESQ